MSLQDSLVITQLDGELDVQELYCDLARKHRSVGNKVDAIWRRFTPKQREEAMRESTGTGEVLMHSRDRSMGGFCEYISEYNLRDMAHTPEHFLNIFKSRALTPLYNQLYEGVDGRPGDRELIEKIGKRFAYASDDEYTLFVEGKHYGKSFRPTVATSMSSLFPGLSPETISFISIPRKYGGLILIRQLTLFLYLNHIVEEILDLGSETRAPKAPGRTTHKALTTATSNLSLQPKPLKSSLPEVRAQAMESKAALEDYLLLLRTEPTVLDQAVNTTYWSRAELVSDDQGRILPALTDRYLSTAFFDVVTAAVKGIAIWDYILCLLLLLDNLGDKVKQGLVLQELSNTCNLEYRRIQENLKRELAPQMRLGGKCFKRITNKASGQSRIVMKGRPADYTVSDPQLHYFLRLCHPDTSPADAVQWIQKLDDHNSRYAEDAKKLGEAEVAALGNLVIIVSFMHTTTTAITMTPMSRKSGLLFTARSTELDAELRNFKGKADFGDWLVPMHNLLEPHKAIGALAALDDFVVEKSGARLGSLYDDIVQDSLKDLEQMYVEAKAKLEKVDKMTTYVVLPEEHPFDGEARLAHRRVKEKTRPDQPNVYAITSPPDAQSALVTEHVEIFQVKPTTASLFASLFSRSEAQGSVSWTSFEAAMADLGFSITPKGGSIFTFSPPSSMETRSITLHRPHVSEIEGYKLLILARRLQRVYGWTSGSFIAK